MASLSSVVTVEAIKGGHPRRRHPRHHFRPTISGWGKREKQGIQRQQEVQVQPAAKPGSSKYHHRHHHPHPAKALSQVDSNDQIPTTFRFQKVLPT